MSRRALAACLLLATANFATHASAASLPVFDPVSTPADAVLRLATLVLAVTAGIFCVVVGLLVIGIVRFRRRPDDDGASRPRSTAATRSSWRGRCFRSSSCSC